MFKLRRTKRVQGTGRPLDEPVSESPAGMLNAVKCGHRTTQAGDVTAFGVTIQTNLPLHSGEVEYCLDCIGSMAIQCAWCALPIFIGDPVTLYSPTDPGFKVPEHAVIFSQKPLRLVGCLRWDCASTGADRAGFWLPDDEGHGHVMRVPTLCEQAVRQGVALTNDIGDARQSGGS